MAFHFSSSPSQEGCLLSRCICCNKPLGNSLGASNWPILLDDMDNNMDYEVKQVTPPTVGFSHKCVGSKRAQGSGQSHGNEQDYGVIMDKFHDLEGQVRLTRNENLDFKWAITCLFTVAHLNHLEVKNHNNKFVEMVDLLEETLGPLHPHKDGMNQDPEEVSSKLEALGRLLAKNKDDMFQASLYIANNAGKTGLAKLDGNVLSI